MIKDSGEASVGGLDGEGLEVEGLGEGLEEDEGLGDPSGSSSSRKNSKTARFAAFLGDDEEAAAEQQQKTVRVLIDEEQNKEDCEHTQTRKSLRIPNFLVDQVAGKGKP